jgi:hypothetical protein
MPEAISRSLPLFIFTVGKAVDTLLESNNIFISTTQEMRYLF